MALLGSNKQTLLNQVRMKGIVDINQLVELCKKYDDLNPEDFKGYIDELTYGKLEATLRDPREADSWLKIQGMPCSSVSEIQLVQSAVAKYLREFPRSPVKKEADDLAARLEVDLRTQQELQRKEDERKRLEAARQREENDWNALDKGNYYSLQSYKGKYPESVHRSELDDFMWNNTRAFLSRNTLARYLADWPAGLHASEANAALVDLPEWESVSRSGDLFAVDDYRDNHPDSPFKNEINSLYYKLRDEMLEQMKKNPSEYDKEFVTRLLDADIFKDYELTDAGLMTEESWQTLHLDRDLFPNIQSFQVEDPNIQAPEGCTDVYLFGTPGTGKTCLLMGLAGADGEGYSLNMKKGPGGPYAAALMEYVAAGLTPGRTYGKFVTTINGHIDRTDKRGKTVHHNINLVEMSGEEFALRIADGQEVSLENMGTGATNLLRNKNRKVFFIIVDPSKEKVKVNYIEEVHDADGTLVAQRVRYRYISQLTILNKFVGLFELPENADIMSRVDAIHFIVTKADILGDAKDRLRKASEHLLENYLAPVNHLKSYCRTTKRINYSSNKAECYSPKVFTFSLGKFYLGDVFDFDKAETLQIIRTIGNVTGGTREKTWWDKFLEALS